MIFFQGFVLLSQNVLNGGPWNPVYRRIVGTFKCVWKTATMIHISVHFIYYKLGHSSSNVCFPLFLEKVSTDITRDLIYKLIAAIFGCV